MAIEKYFIEQGDMAASDDLSDVVVSGAVQNEVLVRDGSSTWVNQLINTPSLEDAAITLAKIADASANSRLLGSGASGSGNPYVELTVGSGLQIVANELSTTGGAGGGDALTQDINQSSHGFSVGDVLDHNGTIFILADRDDEATSDVMGIVSVNTDTNNFEITYAGRITTLTGLTIGSQYYLDSTAGGFTATEPAIGNIIAPIFYALTATTAIVNVQRPIQVTESGTFPEEIKVLTATQELTTTSFVDITGMNFEAAANGDYLVEFFSPYSVPLVSDGISIGIDGPTSPTDVSGQVWASAAVSGILVRSLDSYNDTVGTLFPTSIKTNNFIQASIVIRNGSTAGTVTMRGRKEDGNVTLKIGTTMKVRRIN